MVNVHLRRWISASVVVLLGAAALAAGCSRRQTMASKSATAYEQLVARGESVGAEGHAQMHADTQPVDHGQAPQAEMPEMAHQAAVPRATGEAMPHEPTQSPPTEHGEMEHGAMEHGAMEADASPPPPTLNPTAPVGGDPIDAPATTSVADAERAAALTREMSGGSMQHQHGSTTYRQTDAGRQTTYTCPMHPEVRSDKPGKCPKCGMNLVPKT